MVLYLSLSSSPSLSLSFSLSLSSLVLYISVSLSLSLARALMRLQEPNSKHDFTRLTCHSAGNARIMQAASKLPHFSLYIFSLLLSSTFHFVLRVLHCTLVRASFLSLRSSYTTKGADPIQLFNEAQTLRAVLRSLSCGASVLALYSACIYTVGSSRAPLCFYYFPSRFTWLSLIAPRDIGSLLFLLLSFDFLILSLSR